MIRAIIYDMDGVLVDACATHRIAFAQAVLRVTGRHLNAIDNMRLEGRPTRTKIKMLGYEGDVAEQISALKQELTIVAADAYPRDEKRVRLLLALSGYKQACYTNAVRASAKAFLGSAGLAHFFQPILSNEDVTAPKPDPAGYCKAMRLMGVLPEETLIVEDSVVGLAAARASGARVLKTDFDSLSLTQIQRAVLSCNS